MVARLDHSTAAAEQNASSPPLNCPRCDSTNTKFCYYNNYSLAQPRHFCKSCKRYWTRGGTLRNVPVGGGCRKNKRSKKSAHRSAATATAASASQSLPLPPPVIHSPAADLNSFLYGFPPIINSSSTLFFPKFELDASLPCYEQNLVNLADLHKTAPLDFLGDYSLFNSRIVTSSSPMATTERYHQPLLSYDHDDLNITTENNALNRSINWQALKENSLDGTNSFAALSGGSGGAVAQSQYIYWNQGMSGSWPESGSSVAPLI